jgi:hypothetical protein
MLSLSRRVAGAGSLGGYIVRRGWALALAGAVFTAGAARAVELEHIVPRKDPAFRCDAARLVVGRDGKAYLCSGGNTSFVLRLARDGSDKFGSPVEYAAHNATANAAGVVATANAHFAHKVTVYGPDFARRGAADEFLVNDQVGWDAPAHVEAGAGGDFYAIDQHRDRILKVSAAGKLLKACPVARTPAGRQGPMQDFRVSEKAQAFYILRRSGPLACVGFDGAEKWTFAAGVSWGTPNAGGFDVDDDGNSGSPNSWTVSLRASHRPPPATFRTFPPDPSSVIPASFPSRRRVRSLRRNTEEPDTRDCFRL